MKIVSSNIRKILSLMIAVAIIITSFNTSNIEAKASEDGNNAKSNTTSLSSDKWKLKPDGIQIGTWEDTWKFDPSTDPETYGWDRELCKEMFLSPCFAHHSVGYTFKSSSGINYRVTKKAVKKRKIT